ncbi:MAG: CaiB/BaiF CoA transferase family protein, partial [bacterium]
EVARRLVNDSDVVLENFRPGVMERFGLGYDKLKGVNPGLVYCSITAYGETGPYRRRPGYDAIIQAESGMMSVIGEAGGPPLKGPPGVVDISAGILAAFSIVGALYARERDGLGERINVSLFDTAIFQLGLFSIPAWQISGNSVKPEGSGHPIFAPYQAYETKDEKWVMIAALNEGFWRNLCQALNLEKLLRDPRFKDNPSRSRNRDRLNELIRNTTLRRTRHELLDTLIQHDVPVAPINSTAEALAHQVAEDMLIDVSHQEAGKVKVLGNPAKMTNRPFRIFKTASRLGEDTEEILVRLGYMDQDIKRLKDKGII